jgi:hypothetical protein
MIVSRETSLKRPEKETSRSTTFCNIRHNNLISANHTCNFFESALHIRIATRRRSENDRSSADSLFARMAFIDEEALIARLRGAFAENVKSRSEAAKVRQHITAAVTSHVAYDESGSPVKVESPGNEITGLRRRYLDALKSNVEARERYQQLSVSGRGASTPESQQLVQMANPNGVHSHLESLRLQLRHHELDIRRRYAQSLSLDASTSCNLDIQSTELQNAVHGNNAEAVQDDIATTTAKVKALTTKLQKAVLQANHQLERAKSLLANIKKQYSNGDSSCRDSHAREKAIAATRNVLVAWLDEKLTESSADDGGDASSSLPQESSGERVEGPPSIPEYYERYIDIRKALIQAANEALRPILSPAPTIRPAEAIEEQPQTSEDLEIVHTISQRLKSKQQQKVDLTAFRAYKSATVAKDHQGALEVIKRLADESHLLSAYPSDSTGAGDDLTRTVAAWTSASSAATESVIKVIEQHERAGQEALENGQTGLVQLKSYNGNDHAVSRADHNIYWRGMHGLLERR